ncbi:hypothetical protein [Longimicrobium sp.]|uniref:hypothetical protein n=1 Tax=Longimicrobium sp. TaxID=2029185 RepID=UPI003B3AFAAB
MIVFIRRRASLVRRLLRLALFIAAGIAAPAAAQTSFRGTIVYEKIPVGRNGLQVDAPVRTPAAGVKVEIVASPARTVLGSGWTDEKGGYSIPVRVPRQAQVYVRALAQTENAAVVRAGDRAEFSIVSEPFGVGRERTVRRDLLATDSSRVAGAFNIAVTIWRANSLVRSAKPDVNLPRVEVRWDTTYMGGTFFRPSEEVAFINGQRGRDSDEYDDHVIAHEYGHFLMSSFSRESSPGGNHSIGEQLDPRLAWSEGWGNFFGAATTGNAHYIDTGMNRGRPVVLLSMDLEDDVPTGDRPGIWSEHSVAGVLWDWFDDAPEEGDSVALGFIPLWNAFAELAKEPDVYLLRFANLLAAATKQNRQLQAGLAARGIAYAPGENPRAPEPFPTPLASGTPVEGAVDSRRSRRSNLWGSSAHYWFVVTEAAQASITLKIVTARDTAHADLDLYLYDADGEPVAHSNDVNGVGGTERISRRLEPGYYRVEVRSWSGGSGSRLSDRAAHQGTFTLLARY